MNDHKTATLAHGTWLRLAPEWTVAVTVTLALGLAAKRLAVQDTLLVLALASIAIAWAAGHTFSWWWQTRLALPRLWARGCCGATDDRGLGTPVTPSTVGVPEWALAADYGRFMAWCNRLFRVLPGQPPIPAKVPLSVVGCWLTLLHQAGVLTALDGQDYCLDAGVRTLADIRARISSAQFERAVWQHVRLAQG